MTEREKKIVTWLRRKADDFAEAATWSPAGKHRYEHWAEAHKLAADAIEAGEHMKRPEPTIPASEWKNSPSVGH